MLDQTRGAVFVAESGRTALDTRDSWRREARAALLTCVGFLRSSDKFLRVKAIVAQRALATGCGRGVCSCLLRCRVAGDGLI
jgi:hypothetical protein